MIFSYVQDDGMLSKDAVNKARPVLHQIETELGQTIGLGCLIPDSGFGEVLAAVDGSSGVAFHIAEKHHFALHTSAPGKSIMAYLPVEERNRYYAHMDFQQYTPNTIRNRTDFDAELASVLAKGYSVDVAEKNEGVNCVGVPVFNLSRNAVAAIWTTGPASLMPIRNFEKIAAALKQNSQELTRRIYSTNRAANRDNINSLVEQVRNMMENNLHRPIEIKQIADSLYVSYSWFRQVFKEQTGLAPAEYHLSLRMKKATELLTATTLSIRQISEELGFKNQNHFSALFKRKTGLSPANFRKKQTP